MKKLVLLMLLLNFAGCKEEIRSADFFIEHATERAEVLEGCRSGRIRTRECETAALANAEVRRRIAGERALQEIRRQFPRQQP